MFLYMHAGSLNHGCEAIVRSTVKMAKVKNVLFSEHPEEDFTVGLNSICLVRKQGGNRSKKNPLFFACKLVEILFKNSSLKHWYVYNNVIKSAKSGSLFLSIGGDNYCYGANPYLIYLNYKLNKKGAKTGLWGCSIEPDVLKQSDIVKDMKRYSFISARETITYNALKEAGLTNIHLYPDPAFTLEVNECSLPMMFKEKKVVGINLSPLVEKLDESGQKVLENYVELIKYILNNTDMGIALIPHVCKAGNDDREAMKKLAGFFPKENRIVMVNEEGILDCTRLKYIISKCSFMITARTHASIAAYSTCVPTLVMGYSVKARGIARDIFGREDGYVIDIRELKQREDLVDLFKYIQENESTIRNHLGKFMPKYIKNAFEARNLLR